MTYGRGLGYSFASKLYALGPGARDKSLGHSGGDRRMQPPRSQLGEGLGTDLREIVSRASAARTAFKMRSQIG